MPPTDPYERWWQVIGASLAVALSLVPLWQLGESGIGSWEIIAATASLLVVVARAIEEAVRASVCEAGVTVFMVSRGICLGSGS